MNTLAIALMVVSGPAFAQDKVDVPVTLQSCHPIGQTIRGELIYSLDCKAISTQPVETMAAAPMAAPMVVTPGEVIASVVQRKIQTPSEPSK
jgi:hypothetical protein